MLKECILAAAILVSPGQEKKLASVENETIQYTVKKGTYTVDLNNLLNSTNSNSFTVSLEIGSNNISFNQMSLVVTANTVQSYSYDNVGATVGTFKLINNGKIATDAEKYSTFYVDETQTITTTTAFESFFTNYVQGEPEPPEPPEKKEFSLTTIFEELAEGLKNLAIGFVNAFSGLGKIFYNNGLTYVSIFLIGGVALTIGFWAIDKILSLGKMGLGSLGKARAKKSKKGQ